MELPERVTARLRELNAAIAQIEAEREAFVAGALAAMGLVGPVCIQPDMKTFEVEAEAAAEQPQ